ncbi:MAG TPA: YicC/YloC family endoribonuclease [Flavipsychrobacter sp.]|nr:YicC/YloC family endoribonuclease [Flavipsychrobacter sp.]
MVYSMTGFGRAEGNINNRQVIVEIKSLNGKQFEMGTKQLPPILRSYELDLRNILASRLLRGTIDFNIAVKQDGASKPMLINTDLARYYYQGMKQISNELGVAEDNILSTIMRMPEVIAADQDVLPEAEWNEVMQLILQASDLLMKHRLDEGKMLKKDLEERIGNISALLEKILPLEPQRAEKIKTKLQQMLNTMVGSENVDANRFEQEMIYYLERIDFSEEKIRLKQHCDYFMEAIHNDEPAKGKKLGFILQEIGREINTLGSKANHADIQKIVIEMKDELEKAKEQILNVL